MRSFLFAALWFVAAAAPAQAQQPDIYSHNNTNNFGVNLPAPPTPSGQDQIRTGTGTTCSNSVAQNGPFMDVGTVASQNRSQDVTGSIYARLVIPFGRAPKRIDCAQLYALEIERLRMELELMKMSVGEGMPDDLTVEEMDARMNRVNDG